MSQKLGVDQTALVQFEINEPGSTFLGDSAHGAQLVQFENGEQWVLKQKNLSVDKAQNEVKHLDLFNREGIPTIPMLRGMLPRIEYLEDVNNPARLFLPFIEGLKPLTRVDWKVFVGSDEYSDREDIVRSCMRLAGKMHMRGYSHGDFQIKNIGIMPPNKLITYDLENAQKLDDSSIEEEIRSRKDDLVSFFKSIRINGLFENTDISIVSDELKNMIFGYYEKIDDEISLQVVDYAESEILDWYGDPVLVEKAKNRFKQTNT